MSTRQLSGYQYNASRNTRVFVQELIVKDNLFLGDNCNLVYGLNSQVSFSKTLETEEANTVITDSSGNISNYVTTTTMEDYLASQIDYRLNQLKIDLPSIYRSKQDDITMESNRRVNWKVNNITDNILFINSDFSMFFQHKYPLYMRNAQKIIMGVGDLNIAGGVPNQLEINSSEVSIDTLNVRNYLRLDQIKEASTDQGVLVENFSFIDNTLYSITPNTDPSDTTVKFYPYSPYRLITKIVYSLITTDTAKQIFSEKSYYFDLDGGKGETEGELSRLRKSITSKEMVVVNFHVNLMVSALENITDTFIATLKNHRRDLPLTWNADTANNRYQLLSKAVSEGGFGISETVLQEDSDLVADICNTTTDDHTQSHLEWLREHGIGGVVLKQTRATLTSDTINISFNISYPLAKEYNYDSSYFVLKLETVNSNSFKVVGSTNEYLLKNDSDPDTNYRVLATGNNYQTVQTEVYVAHNYTHTGGWNSSLSYHNLTSEDDGYISDSDPFMS